MMMMMARQAEGEAARGTERSGQEGAQYGMQYMRT